MRRFGPKLLPLALALLLHSPAWGYNAALDGIAQAYGYMLGQELTLTRIAEHYPDLTLQVEQARSRFAMRFPGIQARLETRIRGEVGGMFPEIRSQLHNRIMQTVGRHPLPPESALDFLAEMGQRANGDIESPVLENLLAAQYAGDPSREFVDGWHSRYETGGSGKAKGVRLALQVPRSWLEQEGDRPNVVRKWRSECGYGSESLMLLIFDASGLSPGNQTFEDMRRRGELAKLMPPGHRLLNSGAFSLEGQNGVWLEASGALQRAGMGAYQHTLMYNLPYRGRMVQLLCSAGGVPGDRRQTDAAFERLRPLCGQVLNSMVLLQNY